MKKNIIKTLTNDNVKNLTKENSDSGTTYTSFSTLWAKDPRDDEELLKEKNFNNDSVSGEKDNLLLHLNESNSLVGSVVDDVSSDDELLGSTSKTKSPNDLDGRLINPTCTII